MNTFSLRTIIEDILLIVRNNNISESEDLSRAQIASWVIQYKALLNKRENDKKEEEDKKDSDDSLTKQIGPLELVESKSTEGKCMFRKRTKEKIPQLLGDSDSNIISVQDEEGCPIQFMDEKRRHFHYFRKYTYGEMTCFYDDGYIYVEGLQDLGELKYIYLSGIFSELDEDTSEDEVTIPGWMIPDIKSMIMKNELAFMLNRPSDDSNNSTLASVKPHMPNAARNQEE